MAGIFETKTIEEEEDGGGDGHEAISPKTMGVSQDDNNSFAIMLNLMDYDSEADRLLQWAMPQKSNNSRSHRRLSREGRGQRGSRLTAIVTETQVNLFSIEAWRCFRLPIFSIPVVFPVTTSLAI